LFRVPAKCRKEDRVMAMAWAHPCCHRKVHQKNQTAAQAAYIVVTTVSRMERETVVLVDVCEGKM
jgi:hypothetical protein